jgi:uncharacterized protein YegJ (DUF2314 family)
MRVWLILLLCLVGCSGPRPADVVTRSGEPDAVRIKGEDARLEAARQEARATLPQFVEALKAPLNTQKGFSLKVDFHEGKVHEYMWLHKVRAEGFDFTGVLANRPIQLKKLRHGQRVRVKAPAVADWMYTDGGGLVGGYSIRAIAASLSPAERQRLEQEGGFTL